MPAAAIASLFVIFLWWSSTGVILYLDGLAAKTYRWSVMGASILLLAGFWALVASRNSGTLAGAYFAFGGAMLVWGWNELLFLTGFLTGSRRTACPKGAHGWQRFRFAAESIIYHELALIASGLLIGLACAGGANQLGVQIFALLWLMRLSTKLNVFLGVPNLSIDFLPPHLKYLASFFRCAPMNLLFPVSVTLATVALVRLIVQIEAPGASPADEVAATMLAVLLGLAILEHWFLVLPLQSGDLWKWGLASHQTARPESKPVNKSQQTFGNTPA